jgi:hypothetical protein
MKEAKNDQTCRIDTIVWLRSVIKLTEHKDYVPLTYAFIEKLNSISGVHKINVYEVYGADDEELTDALILKDVLELLSEPLPFYERIRQKDSKLKDNKEPLVDEIQQTVFPIQNSAKVSSFTTLYLMLKK